MADGKTVKIPVEIQMKLSKNADELKQLADDFQEKFSSIDPTSSLYKGLNKLFQQMEGKFTKIKSLTGKSFFSDGDFKRVVKYFEDIDELASTINNKTSKVGATALGIDVPGLKEAKQLLADIKQSVRADKNKNVGQVMSKTDLINFEKYAKDSKFSAGKNYESNTKAMASSVGELTAKFYQLEDAARAAGEAEQQAVEKVENAKAARDAIDKQITAKTMALQIAKSNRTKMSQQLESQLQSVKGPYGSGDKKRITKDILNDYKEIISNVIQAADGSFADGGKTFASILGNWLKVEPSELQAEASQVVATLQQALVKAATNEKGKVAYGSLKKVVGSFTTEIAPGTFLKEEQELQELQNELATKTQELENASSAKDVASTNLVEVKKNLTETESLLKEIQAQLEQLKKMRMEYEKGVNDSYADQERQAREHYDNLEKLGAKDTHDSGTNFSRKVGAVRQEVGNEYEGTVIYQQQQSAAEAEAKQFSDNLKQSVRHWMGAAEIVNIIRNGIRTAISDIKSLDKAMTDIAVVTDMSVSDLWGKISEYMAIAQEYGVTTQGVYEVSQLYYQQGLSASEVMAATTETLKMARQ